MAGPFGLRPTLFVVTGVAFVGELVAYTSPLRRQDRLVERVQGVA